MILKRTNGVWHGIKEGFQKVSRGIAEKWGIDLRWVWREGLFEGPVSLALYLLQGLIIFSKNPECSDFQVLGNFPKMGIIVPVIFILTGSMA